MSTVGVVHPGTQHSWQTALAFQESSQLKWLATSVFFDERRQPYRAAAAIPGRFGEVLRARLRRRFHPDIHPDRVRHFGIEEWVETLLRQMRFMALANRVDQFGNHRFGGFVRQLIHDEPASLLWSYDSVALSSFRAAKAVGLRCVLDQTTPHYAYIAEAERRQYQQYPNAYLSRPSSNQAALLEINEEEMRLADAIVVGSEFCKSTIPSEFSGKVEVIPYGFEPRFGAVRGPIKASCDPPEFAFVGGLRPLKGVPQLLEAFATLRDVARLKLIGPCFLKEEFIGKFKQLPNVELVGGVPREDVVRHLASADFFVFPSLLEGGGIALYEAAAMGLPIIQSNFCGDGVVGENGIRLSQVTPEIIRRAVLEMVQWSPERRSIASDASLRHSANYSWASYRKRVRELAMAVSHG